jgi:hypothetical protein
MMSDDERSRNDMKRHEEAKEIKYVYEYHKYDDAEEIESCYRGLAVTSRDDVIDGCPPCWRYFFRAARVVLMEITLEIGRK